MGIRILLSASLALLLLASPARAGALATTGAVELSSGAPAYDEEIGFEFASKPVVKTARTPAGGTGPAKIVDDPTPVGAGAALPPAEIGIAPVVEVVAVPGRQSIVDAKVAGTRVRVYLIGTFRESTRFMIGTPVAATPPPLVPESSIGASGRALREEPPLLPGSCVASGLAFGLLFEHREAFADIHIRVPLPPGIAEEELVITLYNDRRHIPLDVTQVARDPARPAAPAILNVRLSKAVLNGRMRAGGRLKSGVVTIYRAAALPAVMADAGLSAGLYRYRTGWEKISRFADGGTPEIGRTVLLVHGAFSSVQVMEPLANALAAAKFDVYGLDYDFYQPVETSAVALAAALRLLVSRSGGRVSVVAHGTGGLVARAALAGGANTRHRDGGHVLKLILLATPNAGGHDVTRIQEGFLNAGFPPLACPERWPAGLAPFLATTAAGARLYAALNRNWGRSGAPYFGIIHADDEWVDEASFAIFRDSSTVMVPSGHETISNGGWAAERKNYLLLTGVQAPASSGHDAAWRSEAAIRNILAHLEP